MKKNLLIIMILAPLFLGAQNASDLYEFSSVFYQGTAKSAAMGNAMGAVGQDFSSITINPASLGLFRKSSITFTPNFYISSTKSEYKGSNGLDRAIRVPVSNCGLTWTQDIYEGSLNTVSFALGINQTNNYSYNSFVNGNNQHTSLIDAYFNEMSDSGITTASGLEAFSPNNIYPLYQVFLMDSDESGNLYNTFIPNGGLNQQRGIRKRGNASELTFATGMNFSDKWFFGASINMPYFDRDVTTDYQERNLTNGYFISWTQREYLSTSGLGINAKIGFTAFPAKWLRLGIAFHTPSIYAVEESWYTITSAVFSDGSESYTSPHSMYSYTLTTPYHANASAAFIFGNFGMISVDYEFMDYSTMSASASDYNYTYLNDNINKTYGLTSNIRVGTEWRLQNWCFRGGYAMYGSPFGIDKSELRTNYYSCGLGYTYHRFTIDAAYVFGQRKNSYDLYQQYSMYKAFYTNASGNNVADETNVKETTNTHQLVISFKFRLD